MKSMRTSFFCIPIARMVPISRVRSRTVMRRVLMTPIRMMKNMMITANRVMILSALSRSSILLALSYMVRTSIVDPFHFVRFMSRIFRCSDSVSLVRGSSRHSGASAAYTGVCLPGMNMSLPAGAGRFSR